RYLQSLLPHKKISSAGTGALVDHPADKSAYKISRMNGLSLDGHLGKQFTASMGRDYELILVMEKKHIEQIGKIAPELRGKTMLFGHWLQQRE
ncbi:protein tyrosine phosphatase, partial [Escherichia coli]